MTPPVVVVSDQVHVGQLVALIGYSILCTFCLLLLVYLRLKRHVAFKGDAQATRKVILPAFEPLLWILAVVTGGFTVFFWIALHVNLYTTSLPFFDIEIFYAGRIFVFMLAIVYLCQKSVSVPALGRAVIKSVLLASYTVPVVGLITYYAPHDTRLFFFVRLVMRPSILGYVVYVCFIDPPAGRASPKTLRTYGIHIIIYHVLLAINTILQKYTPKNRVYSATSYMVLVWASASPFFIWSLLRADTEYWRGMGQRAWALQRASRESGLHLELDESISSNRIHLLIETHKNFVIDFAHLELRRKIGAGSSAVVFSGRLRQQKPVAVKVYTPYRFTEEVVAEFSHEAALCASLDHPNIVTFFGMCVCPPTICLVSELCQGSLEDILYAQTKSRSQRRFTRHRFDVDDEYSSAEVFNPQQMLLNIAYMLDCARAVAYIHSFTPPFLHRDIKPANFLVDIENTVKLTDFGDSRRLPRKLPQSYNTSVSKPEDARNSGGTFISTDSQCPLPSPPQIKMTVTGTVSYMAPEMIGCRTGLASYGEAADVYSLAITFWDILYPDREKYPVTNPMLLFEGVLNGWRPPLEDVDPSGADETMPSKLREVITRAWHSDPSIRPTMPQIVRSLECIQEELLSVLAQDLSDDFEKLNTGCQIVSSEKCFTGEFLIERMEDLAVTESREEGLRLGRALMDAGFLHQLHHAKGFEDSDTIYFFDDNNINFCQPLAMLEEAAGIESDDELFAFQAQQKSVKVRRGPRFFSHITNTFSSNGHSSGATSGDEETNTSSCACRLRGQRLNLLASASDRQSQSKPRQRKWHKRSHWHQSRENSSSTRSSLSFLTSPKRVRQKDRRKTENSLTHKLLDGVSDHAVEISDPEERDSMTLARPAA
ncbi:tkl protein kinase [Plasmopara halstedii]|uniref:Tkl protein kinase n=1 Tax=Plasmopara halstedii TaxID=4781 RepID=A0A0P1ARQ8_PLAHL|nr:tkl protein kinase [Plasmopara halstedii]CEG43983.1 tkl protein kinase [Plasmopara halstedii]|eukprot:XP_024580352.1 tkl protein kinase [Plasmopara halstedii]